MDAVLDALECMVCLQPAYDPRSVQCPGGCETLLCEGCCGKVVNSERAKCLVCRRSLRARTVQRHTRLRKAIWDVPWRCPNGCSSAGLTFGRAAGHAAACPDASVGCENSSSGCSWVGLRRDLHAHVSGECVHHKCGAGFARAEVCCSYMGSFSQLRAHREECAWGVLFGANDTPAKRKLREEIEAGFDRLLKRAKEEDPSADDWLAGLASDSSDSESAGNDADFVVESDDASDDGDESDDGDAADFDGDESSDEEL